MPKGGFAVAKLLAEWGFGCENWEFLHFAAISQLQNILRNGALAAKSGSFYALGFRSCKMRVTVLRNGTRVPKSGFAAAKYPAKWSFGCEIGIFHVLGLRSRFVAAK